MLEKDLLTFSANWTAASSVQDLILCETSQRRAGLDPSQWTRTRFKGASEHLNMKEVFDRKQTLSELVKKTGEHFMKITGTG